MFGNLAFIKGAANFPRKKDARMTVIQICSGSWHGDMGGCIKHALKFKPIFYWVGGERRAFLLR